MTSRQDGYDNHHRRIGEKVINKDNIKEQEPNDKRTRLTTSTMTSSIMDHIITCAISQKPPSFPMVTFGLGGLGGRLFPMDWEVWSPQNLEKGRSRNFGGLRGSSQKISGIWARPQGKMGVFNPDFFPELSPKTLGKKRGIFCCLQNSVDPPLLLWFSFGLASR